MECNDLDMIINIRVVTNVCILRFFVASLQPL